MTCVYQFSSWFADTRHVLILQTWHGRSWPHGLGTYPASSFLILSLAFMNVRSVWDFLMSARRESWHDCHIPCAIHSQEGHSICHTSHNIVHSACLQYVCNKEHQKTAYTYQGHSNSQYNAWYCQWHLWLEHQPGLSKLFMWAWICSTYTWYNFLPSWIGSA